MPSKSLEEELQKIRQKELEREAERNAQNWSLPYINLLGVPLNEEALPLSSKKESQEGEFLIFQKKGRALRAATHNPKNPILRQTIEGLKKRGFEVELFFASEASVRRGLEQYDKILPAQKAVGGIVEISAERVRGFLEAIRSLEDAKKLLSSVDLARVTEALEIIFSAAVQLDASDIHLEPGEEGALVRFRVDGILQDVASFSRPVYDKILSRVKILSGLKLNITEAAQDGRFSIVIDKTPVEVRVSTIPAKQGESAVLRILNPKKLITFEELGLREDFKKRLERELAKTTGMILVTGPTGSGKTTTLYAFLRKLATREVKIITIEDPIEYRLEGISQTQVDPKKNYTFPAGLRAIVRQDPDVVLVGEIRDKETASVALHAALTGHLVFSTLHTNDASGTVARLIDMEIHPNIIAPAINVALAQRLIRKACPYCKKLVPLDPEVKSILEKFLKTFPEKFVRPSLSQIKIPRAGGCEKCGGGYKGRVGIFESFVVDKDIEKLILENAPSSRLREEAVKKGMVTVQQDGVLRVLEGITTLEEVERVTGKLELTK